MTVPRIMLIVALFWASPVLAQKIPFGPKFQMKFVEPGLQLGAGNFALPVIEYQAPDGTWKRSSGIIIGHDISPNAAVGIGFFKMAPKYKDRTAPPQSKSRKVSAGFSVRF